MPQASKPPVFAKACQTKKSAITKALDALFLRPKNWQTDSIFTDPNKLKKNHVLDTLSPWAKTHLGAQGVGLSREWSHINKWPKAQKERVRQALIHAINNDVKVEFFWELYGGATEKTTITPDPLPTSGTIKITFISPQKRIRISTAADTFGEIMVDVG
jgi:ABC-type transport system substrate-binding protein